MTPMSRRAAVVLFLAFALAYFLSALIRAITATLSPVLMQEFALQARDLGLLGGAYFLGFSITQLPLGRWLDQHGPRRVLLGFLGIAVLGCLAFAAADSLWGLFAARMLCGVGVSACLMAPLTGYRRWFAPAMQMRSNSWMLMVGSLGMVASTLPVQWLLPLVGWRSLFVGLAGLILLAMLAVAWRVPPWAAAPAAAGGQDDGGYAQVWRNPVFRAMAPMGFFCYGGLVAVQTLWATPWMVTVAGFTDLQAATGLFWINIGMLLAFWSWGVVTPWLVRQGWHAGRLIAWGLPLGFLVLAATIIVTPLAPSLAGVLLAAFCVSCSTVTLSQPAVGMAFAPSLAGRALSAFNLVIFLGVFAVQWSIGLLVDAIMSLGAARPLAFQLAMAVFLGCCMVSYGHFLRAAGHNRAT